MDTAPILTDDRALVRLTELLSTIESTADALRKHVQSSLAATSTSTSTSYDAQVARSLQLPFHADARAAGQAGLLRLAAEQVVRLVQPPRQAVFEVASGFYTSLALDLVLRADVAGLIERERTASPSNADGVRAQRLGELAGLDPDLLARTLRLLASHGIFQETVPNAFLNTVASATIVDNPEFTADLDIVLRHGPIATPFFYDFMKRRHDYVVSQNKDDGSAESSLPPSAFELATGQNFYNWLHAPEQADRARIFQLAMRGRSQTEGLGFMPTDYPFSQLPPDTLIVDVGGGTGSVPKLLLPVLPHLRFVIQELAPVIEQAKASADAALQSWIADGRVVFEEHDFFQPQPSDRTGVVFLLKNILHNFADDKALELLTLLRQVRPSRVLIVDRIVTPNMRTEGDSPASERDVLRRLRGDQDGEAAPAGSTTSSYSLLPSSQRIPTAFDIAMAALHGGRTRTMDEWKALVSRAGLALAGVWPLRASMGQAVLEVRPEGQDA